jgi:hypothetical protein
MEQPDQEKTRKVRQWLNIPKPTFQGTQEAVSLAKIVRDAIIPLLPLK